MTRAYIGLGSNLGDREANLRSAIVHLDSLESTNVLAVSSLYRTKPLGPPQPDYINAVCAVETSLTPRRLLQALLNIEMRLGRKRSIRWGPRTLDLDLLLYGDEIIDEPGLVVPHPRMEERLFVLEPLCEIAPDLLHPKLKLTIRQLLKRLRG